jgi:putative transposase
MAAAGLRGRRPPRWVRTTTPEPTPPAIPDRVHGQFTAAAPDLLWVGDITYVRTWEGWLYLATVLDVFSRRVIGWAIADHLRASLVCAALRMAVATRGEVTWSSFAAVASTSRTSAPAIAPHQTLVCRRLYAKAGDSERELNSRHRYAWLAGHLLAWTC